MDENNKQSKSILVIDTPSGCTNCSLFYYNEMYSSHECKGTNDYNKPIEIYGYQIKPDWCPLSPVLERKNLQQYVDNTAVNMEDMLAYQYAQGWNDYRDTIMKGEN